jgi:hypothetical protein
VAPYSEKLKDGKQQSQPRPEFGGVCKRETISSTPGLHHVAPAHEERGQQCEAKGVGAEHPRGLL